MLYYCIQELQRIRTLTDVCSTGSLRHETLFGCPITVIGKIEIIVEVVLGWGCSFNDWREPSSGKIYRRISNT
jgi:hypothetical protein